MKKENDKTKHRITDYHIQCLEMANNLKVITNKEKEFIGNLTGRYSTFGNATVVTDSQIKWLEDLANKYINVYTKYKGVIFYG